VIAIVGGLVAAVMWATSALCISRSTKLIPPVAVLGWVLLIGSVISAPFALAQGVPPGLGREQVALLVVTAIGNTTGLLLVYSSLRHGKVGVVAPITSAQGAAAAVFAVIAGEEIATGAGIALAAIVLGVVLSSMSRTRDEGSDRREGLAVTFAIVSLPLRGTSLRHAEQMVNAAGLALLSIPVLEVLFRGLFVTPSLPTFWELVLVVGGFGLVAYATADRAPGPAYLGAAVLAAFVFLQAIQSDETLEWWPILLLLTGALVLAAGLRPRAPLPPEPDPYRAGEQPLAARADEEITLRVRDDSPPD